MTKIDPQKPLESKKPLVGTYQAVEEAIEASKFAQNRAWEGEAQYKPRDRDIKDPKQQST
jgi:hypothetical protein